MRREERGEERRKERWCCEVKGGGRRDVEGGEKR